ncbi:Hypothetical_protein [Hexamita inflata]|uniref:Hypothetical_protein n=1 Tax=Hexamita inflata TaxID=28002 RepID=A0AA86NDS6_9EUKA|nr:Hypothetical protein HINF_LOCUS5141 [Hexamita inflata]
MNPIVFNPEAFNPIPMNVFARSIIKSQKGTIRRRSFAEGATSATLPPLLKKNVSEESAPIKKLAGSSNDSLQVFGDTFFELDALTLKLHTPLEKSDDVDFFDDTFQVNRNIDLIQLFSKYL